MVKREELFKEIEDRIEETTEELRNQFFNLGIIIFHNPEIVDSSMGVSLFKTAKESLERVNEAQKKEEDDRLFIDEFEEKREKKIVLDGILESLREEEREVRMKLGALIYEQCSLSILPREKFSSVYAIVDEERTLSDKAQSKSFWSRFTSSGALNRLKRSDTTRYLDYSSFADNPETATVISGEKAQSLIDELCSIKNKREQTQSEEELLEGWLTESVSRRRNLEKGELEEDKNRLSESKSDFDECIINYGNYLYDRATNWINENTPSNVLDSLQAIVEKQNSYSELIKRQEQLRKEAKADDYKAIIEEEREKIRILESEKAKIDLQIAEINKEIERLEGMVSRLVKSQEEERR